MDATEKNTGTRLMDWISVKDDMPKEKDSIFARWYGTERWKTGMFRKTSEEVLVTVEMEDGNRKTMTGKTLDGEWKLDFLLLKGKVTHWMPFPSPAE